MGFELHIYSQDQNGSKQSLQINYSIDCADAKKCGTNHIPRATAYCQLWWQVKAAKIWSFS